MNLCFLSEYQDVMKSFGDLMFMIIRALYCLSIIIIIPKTQLLLINGKKTVNSNKVPKNSSDAKRKDMHEDEDDDNGRSVKKTK